MRRRKSFLLSILVIVFIFIALFIQNPEQRAMRTYDKHRLQLKSDLENHLDQGQPLPSYSGITIYEWNGEYPIVEYLVISRGIVSASSYYGFFYSKDDVPVSFQNSGKYLVKTSNTEWEWKGEGDNHGFVRKLESHWYYFEASF